MGELAITRAIGDSDFKEHSKTLVIAEPEVSTFDISDNMPFMLLACDGLYDFVANDKVVEYIQPKLNRSEEALQNLVLDAINVYSSRDNVTAILVTLH